MSLAVDNPVVDSPLEERDRPKVTAAKRWVKAVHHDGGFGLWGLAVRRRPYELLQLLDELVALGAESL